MIDGNVCHCVSGCNYFQITESFDKLIKVSSEKRTYGGSVFFSQFKVSEILWCIHRQIDVGFHTP